MPSSVILEQFSRLIAAQAEILKMSKLQILHICGITFK